MSMSVRPGERLGIVGENGSGKSTLLRLLAGAERPDSGEVVVTGEIGHLGQTLGLPPHFTVQQAIDAALAGLRAMERRLREIEAALAADPGSGLDALLEEYGELLTAFEARGGYEADARVDRSLHALGLPHLATGPAPSRPSATGEPSMRGDEAATRLQEAADETSGPGTGTPSGHDGQEAMRQGGEGRSGNDREQPGRQGNEAPTRRGLEGTDRPAQEKPTRQDREGTDGLDLPGNLAPGGRDRTLGSLSGGEQARLGLACVLAAAPATLLLDEPTNHLDESALGWLEERLAGYPGTVVVVSHDRIFLDRVVTAVIEVEGGGVTRFGGGCAGFLTAKAAARARWEQAYTAWREEVRQVREHAATTAHRVAAGRAMRDNNKMAYDRNAGRVQSSIATRVRNAQERLRRLEADPVPRPPDPLRFHGAFTAPSPEATTVTSADAASESSRTTPPPDPHDLRPREPHDLRLPSAAPTRARAVVAELRDVRVADRLRVESLVIRSGDRLLVHGHNGAGKSTLLRAVAERAHGRVGHLTQETSFDPSLPVLEAYGHGHPDGRRAALLATGLFRAETLDLRVGALSVGQRRRLALARLLAEEHDVLLLDEPTNHLSPDLAEELEQALDHFTGTLVVVTHDRALRRRFRGTRLEVSGGRVCH
ncbi:ATP-binding cassette domain-containing protein [Nonomuraea roseoviolacea]|uniref:ATPase subunit of ABC transporter with duplicated ATPase domains n=1 Tax=Nonomuraea roseoviolacea subsp. carminata TaxID=160689 RepID=A0ABT1K5V4_9ACTN|nr:ATP-binding cassette domain-containing protein [Nonomuraea roseoviolacea]MCP2349380.1 ATPase subunit of ABC transporter with duplicated ATPase domains [Nonomuraea roseoviolacea subsp. carminata]